MTPHEAIEEARTTVEHIFGDLLEHVRKERGVLGLPAEFQFVFLIQAHAASGEIGAEIIKQFTEGCLINSLKQLLPDYGHRQPGAAKTLALVQEREPLFQILLALYTRGEHDTGFYDVHRSNATLLHIHNVYGRPA